MIKIDNYKQVNKGSLLGFFNVILLEAGISIANCSHFQKDGQQWFNFPQEETKVAGEKSKYFALVRFLGGPLADKLKNEILEALKGQDGKVSSAQRQTSTVQAESPFDFGAALF